jgi:hypothetical protein
MAWVPVASVWALIEQLARELHSICSHMMHDRLWPAPEEPPDQLAMLSWELPNTVLYSAYAPDLSVRVRVTWQHTPHSPPLEEAPQTFENLPAFLARVREAPSDLSRSLLVEFATPPQCTAEELEKGRSTPVPDQWNALMRTRKFLTLHVGLVSQYAGWYPQDRACWKAWDIQKRLRESDRLRRDLAHPGALWELLQQVQQSGDEVGVRDLESTLSALPSGWEHEPLDWLPIWFEPGITRRNDMTFDLGLRLRQWRMIEGTAEMNRFLDRYMRQFKYAFTEEEWLLLEQGVTLGGGEVFAEICRTEAFPESAKGRRQYIAKTLHGRRYNAVGKDADQSGDGLAISPSREGLYSVYTAVRILAQEAYAGQWTPSRDWLDDQMNKGILPVVLDKRGWKCLDEHGLQCARKRVKDENARRALVNYQMDELGKSRRAANKWIQECIARGESPEDMGKALCAQKRGSHP